MTKEETRDIALQHGFKLKEQPDGSMDLNPYVYVFAARMYAAGFGDGMSDTISGILRDEPTSTE